MPMEMSNNPITGLPQVYLGDGAYAEYNGYSVIIFTSNGMQRTNEVVLERTELQNLVEFCKFMHLIP